MIFLLSSIEWTMIAIWAFVFIATLVIELETADLTTIWFCISSAITLILAAFSVKPLYQIIFFVLLSLILVLSTRPLTKNMMKKEIIPTNSDRLIGMVATVTQEITNGEIGEVKVKNELWRAFTNFNISFEIGEKVIIDAIEGNKLLISKLNDDNTIDIL